MPNFSVMVNRTRTIESSVELEGNEVPLVITDTDRLNWILAHGPGLLDGTRGVCIGWFTDRCHHVALGRDYRECIDRAIRGEEDKHPI